MVGTRAAVAVVAGAGLLGLVHFLPMLPGESIPGTAFLAQWVQLAGFASVLLIPVGLGLLIWRLLRCRRSGGLVAWPVPVTLIALPALLVGMMLQSAAASDAARQRAIGNAAELISEIEASRTATGRYPESLLALHPDVRTGVVGIDRFHYEQLGDGYQLVFENPRYLPFGTRELVVYNPRGEQLAVSHAVWRMNAPHLRGWYTSGEAAPGWRWFWFD